MSSRTEFAFRCSAEKLFEQNSHVYFWTFTCKSVHPDWFYGSIWHRFIDDLQNLYGGTLKGIKVIELHENHGIHWHALLNKRIWAGEVRRLGSRYGIGRIHVKRADTGAIEYLCKYLTKQCKTDKVLYAKVHRWSTVGGFKGTRKQDIEIDSPFHRRVKRFQEITGVTKLGWVASRLIMEMQEDDDDYLTRIASNTFYQGS